MKASYWQRGESLDYKNETSKVIEENTVISIGTRIGVAGMPIAPGETGSLLVVGVFVMDKTDDTAMEMGVNVYFDGNGITSKADNGKTGDEKETYTPAGYVAERAAADHNTVIVKLWG